MAEYITEAKFDLFLKEEAEHHKEADDRVRAVEVQVAAVGQQVAALGMGLSPMQEQLKQHHKTLYGNGEIGMDEQIRQIFVWMQEQKDVAAQAVAEKKESSKWWKSEGAKYAFFFVTMLATQAIVFFFGR